MEKEPTVCFAREAKPLGLVAPTSDSAASAAYWLWRLWKPRRNAWVAPCLVRRTKCPVPWGSAHRADP